MEKFTGIFILIQQDNWATIESLDWEGNDRSSSFWVFWGEKKNNQCFIILYKYTYIHIWCTYHVAEVKIQSHLQSSMPVCFGVRDSTK